MNNALKMKKNLYSLLMLLCYYSSYSQEYEYNDSLESVQINIKADFDSTYGFLNLSYLPIDNLLIDKTLWIIQPESYNGITDLDTLNNSDRICRLRIVYLDVTYTKDSRAYQHNKIACTIKKMKINIKE